MPMVRRVSRGRHIEKTATRGICGLSVALNQVEGKRERERETERETEKERERERHVVPIHGCRRAILLRFEHVGWRSTRRRWRSKGATGVGRGWWRVKGTSEPL